MYISLMFFRKQTFDKEFSCLKGILQKNFCRFPAVFYFIKFIKYQYPTLQKYQDDELILDLFFIADIASNLFLDLAA